MTDLDLRGKDYFRQNEAAHYIGASEDKFREFVRTKGIPAAKIAGTLKYRKADLQRAVEEEWRK